MLFKFVTAKTCLKTLFASSTYLVGLKFKIYMSIVIFQSRKNFLSVMFDQRSDKTRFEDASSAL